MLQSSFRRFLSGVVLLTLTAAPAIGQDAPGGSSAQSLFVDALEWEDPGVEMDPTVTRGRPVTIDVIGLASLMRQPGDTLELDLFDDASFVGVLERVETRSPDSYTLMGRLAEEEHSSFTLAVKSGVVVANIRVPTKQAYYQIRYLGLGVHVIREIDQSEFPACGVGPEMGPPPPAQPAPNGGPGRSCDDDGTAIDVLVVYTPTARAAVGGTEAMEALIDLAFAESNIAYTNSLINTELRLAHQAETDYNELGSFSDHLYRLTDPVDGFMDEVHTLRELYRADMVTLLVNDTQYCGIAWVMTELSPDFEAYAFNVVAQNCATGYYSFSHELGHNQGCAHDRANAGVPGLYDYSYGYQNPDGLFRTVMAYNCPTGCPRIDHFSNPDVDYTGLPTGVPVGEPDAAHNALTINNTALTVANFRKSFDCNDNGICDDEDIANGTSEDCNDNGTPDECEFDCNDSGVPDDCDIAAGTSDDCNDNGIPDECIELESDCNGNTVPDECDLAAGTSPDCNENGIPDDCEGDCNNNGTSDYCDALDGTSPDENGNGYPDECEPPILYVNENATGLNNGQSWPNAFNDPCDALRIAANAQGFVEEVWVATGSYIPTQERIPDNPRTVTFQLVNGVGIYGGFIGNETERDQRDPTNNVTTLSGDLYRDDGPNFANYDENAWHVVTASDTDETAVLDGFTVRGGNADGPYDGPYINGYNCGGAMFMSFGSSTLVNCVFADSTTAGFASHAGGVAIHRSSSPTFIDCSFVENNARFAGGMNVGGGCDATLINCTFLGNWTSG
jgi:hypothetical protein